MITLLYVFKYNQVTFNSSIIFHSVSLQAMEEIDLYVKSWYRLIDILQCQEAMLHECLGDKGYDTSSFTAYDAKRAAWTNEEVVDEVG